MRIIKRLIFSCLIVAIFFLFLFLPLFTNAARIELKEYNQQQRLIKQPWKAKPIICYDLLYHKAVNFTNLNCSKPIEVNPYILIVYNTK